ncbi:MAG: bifunctional 4-hydroxy-2-oxoglutarate aldolase/2-dehydro-3-deoxy-phosphogluconate aldolase [Pseudomonadota bacterium]
MTPLQICRLARVIPVLTVDDPSTASDLGRALISGGLPALEVTLRTPAALDAIRAMAGLEGGVVGAGTLLSSRDVEAAKEAGARFGVSPGTTQTVLDAAAANDLPLLPGVSTASEVMALLERGIETMKFFPAEAAGGTRMLKALSAPLQAAKFCPTGGISLANAPDYLALTNVVCVGGSWVAPREAVMAQNWAEVEKLALDAASRLHASINA